jgi:hypothetical protein
MIFLYTSICCQTKCNEEWPIKTIAACHLGYLQEVTAMNTASEPEDYDNLVIYERASDRRRGIERRRGGQSRNKDLHQEAEKNDKAQPSADNKFIGEFGWSDSQQ